MQKALASEAQLKKNAEVGVHRAGRDCARHARCMGCLLPDPAGLCLGSTGLSMCNAAQGAPSCIRLNASSCCCCWEVPGAPISRHAQGRGALHGRCGPGSALDFFVLSSCA